MDLGYQEMVMKIPPKIPLKDTKDKGAKNAPANFSNWIKAISNPQTIGETNSIAVLVRMGQTLYENFPETDKNTYGRVGKMSKQAGSAARLAAVFWEHGKQPLPIPLDYLTKVLQGDAPREEKLAKSVDAMDSAEFFKTRRVILVGETEPRDAIV